MKKYFLTSVILFAALHSFSQQIRYGIKAGINFSRLNDYYNGAGFGSLTTFEAGGVANIFISNIFFVEPELLFSEKGNNSAKLYYVEIPVNIMFHERLETSNLNFGFGPYLGIGIAGKVQKYNYDNNYNPIYSDNKVKFGNSPNDDFKKTDFGVNLKAGFQIDMGVFASLNYSIGLMNIVPPAGNSSNISYSVKNSYFGISVGYMFKGKKK